MKKFLNKKFLTCILTLLISISFINEQSMAYTKHNRHYRHNNRVSTVKKAPTKKPVVVAKPTKPAEQENNTIKIADQKPIQTIQDEKLLPAALKPEEKDTPSVFSVFSSLIAVIGLIFFCAWAYLKFNKIAPQALIAQKMNEANLNKINLLSTTNLGQGKGLHLIEINGKKLVIGSSSNNINLLTEVPAPPENVLTEQTNETGTEPTTEAEELISKYQSEHSEPEIGNDIYKEYLNKNE